MVPHLYSKYKFSLYFYANFGPIYLSSNQRLRIIFKHVLVLIIYMYHFIIYRYTPKINAANTASEFSLQFYILVNVCPSIIPHPLEIVLSKFKCPPPLFK